MFLCDTGDYEYTYRIVREGGEASLSATPSFGKDESSKPLTLREKNVKEFLTTEEEYVCDCKVAVSDYWIPLFSLFPQEGKRLEVCVIRERESDKRKREREREEERKPGKKGNTL